MNKKFAALFIVSILFSSSAISAENYRKPGIMGPVTSYPTGPQAHLYIEFLESLIDDDEEDIQIETIEEIESLDIEY